ncbi:DUF885 domain-containing protein [Sandarakinorhabdus limnophila]|uniref:DUF885 domain-containing protein n=1 Tax=Sandarakinorhabdus limnophila TaxID=210512 RepID=UPI0026F2A007|nr:DUF885 family protein [Sandarakinorhabdus limnophila]MCM0033713.1 DUF885 family protein [Sandarakinorhabdus limnophila]
MIRTIITALLLAGAAQAQTADQRLKAVYTSEWQWRLAQTGQVEDGLDTRPGPRLPCVTPACQAERQRQWQGVLDQIAAIPDAELSPAERLNKAVLAESLRAEVVGIKWRSYEMPINSDVNVWNYLPAQVPFRSVQEYRNYISRMRDIPRWFDEHAANMRSGMKRGFTPPAVTMKGRDATLANQIKPGKDSPFYAPFTLMPASIPAFEQDQLRAEAREVIETIVNPAQTRMLAFLRTEYLPGARASTAARDLPDGVAWYRDQVKEFTTTDLTPDAIHQIGLKEVARIDADLRAAMVQSGFKGEYKDFLVFLRTDPQFYARTPDELLGFSSYVIKRMDGKLKDIFTTLPRHRFTLRPVADAIAPTYTSGRGGLDACYMNTYDLKSRPLFMLTALTLHECVPGHSHQGAMALEAPAAPPFRRQTYFSGYGEGWGLYTEYLGRELGMYRNPYEEFGRASFENWRASRLVVDTGLHLMGWSRDQAIAYLEEHTALARHDIEIEVDRYISWPGQALAYKLGEMSIRKLRSEAETSLGTGFDLRRFHDTLLGLGSVPLPVMEAEMRDWMAREKAKVTVAR